VVHNSTQVDVHSLLKQLRLTVNSHNQAWDIFVSVRTLWKAPPHGYIKANFDAAIQFLCSLSSDY
jgi:hypothetical protein